MKAYLLWRGRQCAAMVGAPGLLAVVLLLACAALQVLVLAPLRERNAALAWQQHTLPAPRLARPAAPANLASALPPAASATQSLATLYAAAMRHSVQLEQGDYTRTSLAGSGIAQLDIALPLKAAWPQLHGFIGQALADLPHAALAGLRMARQKSDAAQLEAQLRFRLFMQAAP